MTRAERMLRELDVEAEPTARVLERVPNDKLHWRPHARSRTLGQLALHVAIVPGAIAEMAMSPSPIEVPNVADPEPASAGELVPALRNSIAQAHRALAGAPDEALDRILRLTAGDRELMALPAGDLLRSVMLNHWYHHRGQLTVYLRELDVPVPAVYGPSADENPWAEQATGNADATLPATDGERVGV